MRERRAERSIDVVFVSHGPAVGARRLLDALRDQGLTPRRQTMVDVAAPGPARAGLASALLDGDGGAAPGDRPRTPLAVLDAALVVNAPPLGAVLDDPRIGTGALAVREDGAWAGLGVLKIGAGDRAVAAEALRRLPDGPADLILDLTRALAGAGVDVRPVPLGGYAWARPAGPGAAREAEGRVAAVDERRVRLREAARGGDGFYSTFVLRKLSWRLTGLAERAGLTPNQVTLASFGLGLVAAASIAVGTRPGLVAGALLLQVCLIVDCVDGELARYRRRFSRFGAWLDATTDRVKEFAAIAALAVAAARAGEDVWRLAAAAIALQTFRNLLDLAWALQRAAAPAAVPLAQRWAAPRQALLAPSGPGAGPGAMNWVRRLGHFPIGERFLLISLGAAFWTPGATLIALLAAGLLAAGYLLAAFAVRSRPARTSGLRVVAVADAGPVLGALLRLLTRGRAGRSAAALPAVLAVAELALTWGLSADVAGARPGAALALVASVAVSHYQRAYGVREDGVRAVPGAGRLPLGADARLLLLVVLTVAVRPVSPAWATAAVWALAALVAVMSTAGSLRAWLGPGRDGPEPASPTIPSERSEPIGPSQLLRGADLRVLVDP